MRILGYIDHPSYVITVFQTDTRYLLKVESGMYEQTYKFRIGGRVENLEDLKSILDEAFLNSIDTRFGTMHRDVNQALMRKNTAKVSDEFDEIF